MSLEKINNENVVNINQTTDPAVITNTIEVKAESTVNNNDEPKPFLTKKKVILAIIFIILSLGFIVITIWPILQIKWSELFKSIGASFIEGAKLGYLWIFIMVLHSFITVCRCFITLLPRLRKMGYKIKFGECLLFGITVCFLGLVTPANLIIDPYTIFWMRTHGVPTSKCASILFTNSLFWQISTIIINLPIFIMCCIYKGQLTGIEGSFWFTMTVIGFILDYICLVFLYFMCTSRRFHYRCSVIFNWLKKKFHMKYHTKPEIVEKYKTNAVIKQDFYGFIKDWKTSSIIFTYFFVGEVWGICQMPFSMYLVQYTPVNLSAEYSEFVKVGFNFGWVFICGKLSSLANRVNFLPGAAMGYEAALKCLISALAGWSDIFTKSGEILSPELSSIARSDVTHNGILTAKVFGSYLPAAIGIGGFIALTVQQVRAKKRA